MLSDHFGHKFKELSSLHNKKKSEIESAHTALKEAPPSLSLAVGVLTDVMNEIDARNIEVHRQIKEAFVAILAAVEKREKELHAEADAMAMAKKTRLKIQQEDLEKLNDAMKLTLDSVERGAQSYSPEEFLAIQKFLK